MPTRSLLAAVALLAAPVLASASAFASPNDLTIVTRDDSLQRAVQSAYVQPFTAVTGAPVQQEIWEGGIDALRTQAKGADHTWDLVLVDADELSAGCGEGSLEKLDWSAIGGKDHYLPQAVSDCGVGAVVDNTVLAWDKDKLPVAPSWADFWDVAKYPGKRGLHKGVRGNLEFALMADGVAPADVYKTLSTSEGVDRAFRKLDQLKPYIEWWSTETEAARILASGDVLMTSAPSGQIAVMAQQEHKNFGLQFTGSLYEVQSWAIMKGSPLLRMAQQFLYFTGMPAVEVRLLQQSGNAGLAKGLNDGLPPELVAESPSSAANLAAGLKVDAGFWHDNLAKLRQRFDAWQGH
jgi:putative spermidine/putrescine transport system substrate-binding protein